MCEGIIRIVMQCTNKILCYFSPTNSHNLPHRSPDMAKCGVFSVCLHSEQKELPFSWVSYFDQCRVMVARDEWDEYLKYYFCFFIWRMKILFHSYLCTCKWKQDLIKWTDWTKCRSQLTGWNLVGRVERVWLPLSPLTHLHPPWPLWNTHSFPMPLCYPISLLGCNVNNSVHSEVLMPALASQTVK